MKKTALLFLALFAGITLLNGQIPDIKAFMPDSVFESASVSFTVADLHTGEVICSLDPGRALAPASVNKLVSTSAALELLGPDYRFLTVVGYIGSLSGNGKTLSGDIIIRGGGDPTLGSPYFPGHSEAIVDSIALAIQARGIKRIKGRIIGDETIYGFNPASSRWSWGDLGNYYGAGPNGLSVFDNTLRISFRTGVRGSVPEITSLVPEIPGLEIRNYLIAEGTTDRGYVFSAPYSTYAWITGYIPENRAEFVLRASIPDPPLVLASLVTERLASLGIRVDGGPATARTVNNFTAGGLQPLFEQMSPPLSEIVKVTNHESVNLYAEHLLRQTGYEIKGSGTLSAGIDAINEFLDSAGINHTGVVLEDGSGLAARNSITSEFIVGLIRYMLTEGSYPDVFRNSLPVAGETGTMKSYFRDPLFAGNLRAKTGTISRVRCYAGIFTAASGREMVFCILVNNYSGPLSGVNRQIEEIFRQLVINY